MPIPSVYGSWEFEAGVCKWGTIISCTTQARCSSTVTKRSTGATATLLKYENADCSGNPTEMQFPTGIAKGSPCFNMDTYSIKDQYCDTDGKFKQTIYAGKDCIG